MLIEGKPDHLNLEISYKVSNHPKMMKLRKMADVASQTNRVFFAKMFAMLSQQTPGLECSSHAFGESDI